MSVAPLNGSLRASVRFHHQPGDFITVNAHVYGAQMLLLIPQVQPEDSLCCSSRPLQLFDCSSFPPQLSVSLCVCVVQRVRYAARL